jgi:hypothetical protein
MRGPRMRERSAGAPDRVASAGGSPGADGCGVAGGEREATAG